jgi:hypothetical protein
MKTGVRLTFLVLVFLIVACGGTPAEKIDKSPELQRKRQDFIDKIIKQGVFSKVEMPGSVPHVWVRPKFSTLDFESKKTAISIVYAFFFDSTAAGNVVRIRDSITGKDVGTFSGSLGLRLD